MSSTQPQPQKGRPLTPTEKRIGEVSSKIESIQISLGNAKMKMISSGCPNLDSFEESSKLRTENYLYYEKIFRKCKELEEELQLQKKELDELCQTIPVDDESSKFKNKFE